MDEQDAKLWCYAIGMAVGVGLMKLVNAIERLDQWNVRRHVAKAEFESLIADFGGKLVSGETAEGICKRLDEINAKHKAVRRMSVFVKDTAGKPVPVRLS
jgi:hypothetical protein